MIIFINGAFGVGKTTVAEMLVSRIPNSLLFDPEEVGYFLRNIVNPIEQFEDFQDLALWPWPSQRFLRHRRSTARI